MSEATSENWKVGNKVLAFFEGIKGLVRCLVRVGGTKNLIKDSKWINLFTDTYDSKKILIILINFCKRLLK